MTPGDLKVGYGKRLPFTDEEHERIKRMIIDAAKRACPACGLIGGEHDSGCAEEGKPVA